MKNVRIGVEVSRTLNLGNYNSARFQANISFDIEDGDNVEERFRDAWRIAENEATKKCENP